MKQLIGCVALVVDDYDEAIRFYVGVLGFTLVEDTFIEAQDKRWLLVAPPGATGTKLLLARAVGPEQAARRQPDWRPRIPVPAYRRLLARL